MFGKKVKAPEVDFAEMMAAMGGCSENHSTPKPISKADLDKGFDPIADLKPGDKIRAKSEKYNNYTPTKNGVIITVNRVGTFADKSDGDSQVYENDFTALFDNGHGILELAFDSRRFERVTE